MLFSLDGISKVDKNKEILKKAQKYNTIVTSSGDKSLNYNKLLESIKQANKTLEPYKDRFIIVTKKEELAELEREIKRKGVFALDTETTGLDPFSDQLVSIQIYCGQKYSYYIPLNHKSYYTGAKEKGQANYEDVKEFLNNIKNCKIVTHNYSFDINFIWSTFNVVIPAYFDTYIAGRLLNENEKSHGLKDLFIKYVKKGDGEVLKYSDTFKKLTYDKIPIELAYLYGSYDPIMTWQLFRYYQKVFQSKREDIKKIANVFYNIEMPLATAVASMERNGMFIDENYNHKLSIKYKKDVEKYLEEINNSLKPYSKEIKLLQADGSLDTPINYDSSDQVSKIIYDIMGEPLKQVDGEFKKPTGKEFLKEIDNEFTNAMLEYRKAYKVYRDFIETLPDKRSKDNKIHTSLNQVGTDTLRFSSRSPNLQQIPSKDEYIRKMFIPANGNVFVSGDYSKQEVVIIAFMSEDEALINNFSEGKDIYSSIASLAFDVPYEECLEFREDGSVNHLGKERRGQAKAVVLGILYGKGIPNIAKDLGISTNLAHEVYNKIMVAFPNLAKFIDGSIDMAKEKGYVTTFYGTKRRLPDIQRETVEIKAKEDIPSDTINYWKNQYLKTFNLGWSHKKEAQSNITLSAEKQGIKIIDNEWKIAELERKCCNSRIQGSASYMMKKAILNIYNDSIMVQNGVKLVLTIHDEVIIECPKENAEIVQKRLGELMIYSAKQMGMDIKVDLTIDNRWTGDLTKEQERGLLS